MGQIGEKVATVSCVDGEEEKKGAAGEDLNKSSSSFRVDLSSA